MKRIGIIVAGSAYPMDGFKSGLQDLGWIDGEFISFEVRAAEGQLHRLSQFATEMVNIGVELSRCEQLAERLQPFQSCSRWLSSRSAMD